MTIDRNDQEPDTRQGACPEHGTYERGPWRGRCPACTKHSNEQEQARCKAEANARSRKWYRSISGLAGKDRFLHATFDNFIPNGPRQQKVLDACKRFAESIDGSAGEGLWLTGSVGTGKTHLGAAMVNWLIESDPPRSAAIFSAREIVQIMRATWGRDKSVSYNDPLRFDSEAAAIEVFGSYRLLVLDEVGVGYGTEAEQTQLFDVLDLRYQRRRPTVLLSNLTVPMIGEVLGERMFDRMQEGAKVLVCHGPSHRDGPVNRRLSGQSDAAL